MSADKTTTESYQQQTTTPNNKIPSIELLRLNEAGILNQSRRMWTRMPTNLKLYDDPKTQTSTNNGIINTLLNAKNSGKAENTLRSFASSLRTLSKNADLNNPESVKAYLANSPHANVSKNRLALA